MRDAEDWARRTEDEMVRGAVLQPGGQHSQTDTGQGPRPYEFRPDEAAFSGYTFVKD